MSNCFTLWMNLWKQKPLPIKYMHCIDSGVDPDEIAVLYRINALSRSLEEGFSKEGLNFKLIGGMRFYERAEIKDIISYFRVLANPHDDFSLIRIINKPKRGIGKASIEKLQKAAFASTNVTLSHI